MLRVVREFLVLFENYAGLNKDRNCMLPCTLSDAVPQSIFLPCVSTWRLSVALLYTSSHCSVFKVQVVERNFTSLASPLGKARAVPFFLLFPFQTLRWFEMEALQLLLKPDRNIHSCECFDLVSMVEIVGFEPATSCLQGRRSPS